MTLQQLTLNLLRRLMVGIRQQFLLVRTPKPIGNVSKDTLGKQEL